MALDENQKASKHLATFVAKVADEKIAKDILILDLSEVDHAPATFFVICTAESNPQVSAIAIEISKRIKEYDVQIPKVEGMDALEWVLIDFFDVVVHVFQKQARSFYQLEKLWGDASFYQLSESSRLKRIKDAELKKYMRELL